MSTTLSVSTPSNSVAWSPCAALPVRCELHGPDELLRLARPVFASFAPPCDCDDETPVRWTWSAQREDDGRWTCERDDAARILARIPLGLINQIEFDCVRRLAFGRKDDDLFGLHGALLFRDERAIFLTGPKEAGKSTLAFALWQSGWHLSADDFVLVRVDDTGVFLYPVLRRVSLRRTSQALLGDAMWTRLRALPSAHETLQGLIVHPDELHPQAHVNRLSPCRLDALFFVGGEGAPPAPAGAPTCGAMRATEAMFHLLAQTTHLAGEEDAPLDLSNWGDALPQLSAFTARIASFRLRRAPLPTMLRAVEDALSDTFS